MSLPRLLRSAARPLLAVVLATALVAGCSLSDDDPEPGDATAAADPTTSTSKSPKPAPSPSVSGGVTPSEKPTSDQIGSGDSEGDDEPATAGGGVCTELSAAEVGAAVKATVKGSALGGVTGCKFATADQRKLTLTVEDTQYKSGSMAQAQIDANAAVEGEPEFVDIGAEAFVVTGGMFGGDQIQGAGAVHVEGRIVTIALTQGQGLTPRQVRAALVAVLTLVADELG